MVSSLFGGEDSGTEKVINCSRSQSSKQQSLNLAPGPEPWSSLYCGHRFSLHHGLPASISQDSLGLVKGS